jgi:hypothetical protein
MTGYLQVNSGSVIVAIVPISDLRDEELTFQWAIPGEQLTLHLYSGAYPSADLIGSAQSTSIVTLDACTVAQYCATDTAGSTWGVCAFPTTAQVISQLTTPTSTAPFDLYGLDKDIDDVTCAPTTLTATPNTWACVVLDASDTSFGPFSSGSALITTSPCPSTNPSQTYTTAQCTDSCTACEEQVCSTTLDGGATPFDLPSGSCSSNCACSAALTATVSPDHVCSDAIDFTMTYPADIGEVGNAGYAVIKTGSVVWDTVTITPTLVVFPFHLTPPRNSGLVQVQTHPQLIWAHLWIEIFTEDVVLLKKNDVNTI